MLRRRRHAKKREKRLGSTRNSPRIHSHGRFERRTTGEAENQASTPPMASGGGGKDSGREESVWRFGKVEEGLGKVLTQGIELE